VFILAALDSSVLPTLGAVDALTIVLAARHPELWPYYAMCSTAGSVCGASVAYRLSGLGVLHRRIKGSGIRQSHGILASFWEPCPGARRAASATIPNFRIRAFRRCNALSLHCVCAVLRYRTGVPICFTGLSRVCVWQAIRGEGVVGPHAGTSSGFWRCAGVYRVAGVAHLQEIGTAYALRLVTLFSSQQEPLIAPVPLTIVPSSTCQQPQYTDSKGTIFADQEAASFRRTERLLMASAIACLSVGVPP
jgi:hypothetical protein